MKKHIRHGVGKGVITALRRGEILQREFKRGGVRWRLSNGTLVSPSVVKRVLASVRVTPVGDGLFPGFSQSFAITRLARGPVVSQSNGAAEKGQTTMDMSRYVKKFIRLADVAEGPIQQRIARVEEGKFGKPDLVFDSGESVGLNLTSNLALQRAYGQDSDDWIGKLVELYAGEVTFEGKTQTAVLIKPITPGLTAAEKLVPVAAAAAAKPVGRDKADNADMAGDDIPF